MNFFSYIINCIKSIIHISNLEKPRYNKNKIMLKYELYNKYSSVFIENDISAIALQSIAQ